MRQAAAPTTNPVARLAQPAAGWALCGHEAPAGFGGDDAAEEQQQEERGQGGQAQQGPLRQEGWHEGLPQAGQKRGREDASLHVQGQAAAEGSAAHAAAVAEPWRPQSALLRARKIAIGGRCKRLIDAARLRWLRRQGFASAGLVQYVAPSVSGENRLLLAVAAPGDACGEAGARDAAAS